jgi:hypothetical protein
MQLVTKEGHIHSSQKGNQITPPKAEGRHGYHVLLRGKVIQVRSHQTQTNPKPSRGQTLVPALRRRTVRRLQRLENPCPVRPEHLGEPSGCDISLYPVVP